LRVPKARLLENSANLAHEARNVFSCLQQLSV
jgi:hypothetical protein